MENVGKLTSGVKDWVKKNPKKSIAIALGVIAIVSTYFILSANGYLNGLPSWAEIKSYAAFPLIPPLLIYAYLNR